MSNLIVVHDGIAHEDDMVAAGALMYHLHKQGCSYEDILVSRVPNKGRITIENIQTSEHSNLYYVDIGQEYDEKNKWDHHQDDPQVRDECALSLIVNKLFPVWMKDPDMSAFIDRVRLTDTKGAGALKNTGFFTAYVGAYMIPIRMLLKNFENNPTGIARLWAEWFEGYEIAKVNTAKAVQWISENSSIWRGKNGLKVMMVKPYEDRENIPDEEVFKNAMRQLSEQNQIHVTVSYDPDAYGKGKRILRFFRNAWAADRVDFKRYTGPHIFIHKAGFLASVEETDTALNDVLAASVLDNYNA